VHRIPRRRPDPAIDIALIQPEGVLRRGDQPPAAPSDLFGASVSFDYPPTNLGVQDAFFGMLSRQA